MTEIYVNISNFPNYQISNFGNCKNVSTGRILKPGIRSGYLFVNLFNDGDIGKKSIHKMVANAFILNPENKRCVNHIDHNRTNNNVSNLRYATDSENCQNCSMTPRNTSGAIGVCFNPKNNKWKSTIKVNGRQKHLGYFVLKEDAIRVRQEAEILYFREFSPYSRAQETPREAFYNFVL